MENSEFVELAGAIIGAVLSFMLERLPRVRQWFAALAGEQRAAVVVALSLAVSLALAGGVCYGGLGIVAIGCDAGSVLEQVFYVLFYTLTGTQLAHRLSKGSARP